MKAIVKQQNTPGALALVDVPMPQLSAGSVLIKVHKTAICGTDIHIYNWDAWAQRTIRVPQIIGHEFVGEVIEVGRGVSHIPIGAIVSAEGHLICGSCRHCVAGQRHVCPHTQGIGVNMDGVFGEYVCIPASNVWVCNPDISHSVLSVMDPLGNALHTALAFDVLGEDVLVTGAGPIGLMSVPILRRAGARSVVITDVNQDRLDMAARLGASHTVNVSRQSLTEAVRNMRTIKEGFDVGLEMSGSPQALGDMLACMANGGCIAVLGILPAETTINWDRVVFGSLTITGIYGRKMFDTWYKCQAMLETGLADEISQIITHHFAYTDFAQAFELMAAGKCGKVVLDWI